MSADRLVAIEAAIEAAIRTEIKTGQVASILENLGRNRMQHEDAPDPVDPDAEAVEAVARVMHDQQCADNWDRHGEGTRAVWREDARDVLATLLATHYVTPRAEQ